MGWCGEGSWVRKVDFLLGLAVDIETQSRVSEDSEHMEGVHEGEGGHSEDGEKAGWVG